MYVFIYMYAFILYIYIYIYIYIYKAKLKNELTPSQVERKHSFLAIILYFFFPLSFRDCVLVRE